MIACSSREGTKALRRRFRIECRPCAEPGVNNTACAKGWVDRTLAFGTKVSPRCCRKGSAVTAMSPASGGIGKFRHVMIFCQTAPRRRPMHKQLRRRQRPLWLRPLRQGATRRQCQRLPHRRLGLERCLLCRGPPSPNPGEPRQQRQCPAEIHSSHRCGIRLRCKLE